MGSVFSQIGTTCCRFRRRSKRLSLYTRQNAGVYDTEFVVPAHHGTHRTQKQKRHISQVRKMLSEKKTKPRLGDSRPSTIPDCTVSLTRFDLDEAAITAVKDRNIDVLLQLMRQNRDGLPLLPTRSCNPVELACSLGYFDIVEIFLENGCSPNLPTSVGKLLHSVLDSIKSHSESVESGRKLINVLVNSGCELNIKDYKGATPLFYCAQIGNSEIMKIILDKCSSKQLTCRCTANLYTPLHMSVMRGDFECVKLLLSYSPHTHVNLKDCQANSALHLALKSMLHNISYLNAARDSLVIHQRRTSEAGTAARLELQKFQQNAVAIIEALVMAGADVHAACCTSTNRSDVEEYYPLIYALRLCAKDQTQGFELDNCNFTVTLNLVSTKTIQSLENLGKNVPETAAREGKSVFSPYAGVVRLLVLAGTEVSQNLQVKLYNRFDSLTPLLDEVCAFWDKYQVTRPPRLVHLAKLKIRSHLANIHRLHEISHLPLPPRMKEYVKLNYL